MDRIERRINGDPTSALVLVKTLDLELNDGFLEKWSVSFPSFSTRTDSLLTDSVYVLVDLSHILFVCIAINLRRSLLDCIEIFGYIFQVSVTAG